MEELIEEWKELNGYKISNYGTIIGKNTKGEPMKFKKNKGGYLVCKINLGEPYGIARSVHRAVAMAFIPNTENKSDVNHIDANKENNRVDNLEWATRQENMTHSSENRLHPKTAYCCTVDDEGNITNTFNSTEEARAFLPNSASGIMMNLYGNTNSVHGIKFRYWNPEDNTYVKTKYDNPNYKWTSTQRRKILCDQNGKIYNSKMEASRDLNMSSSSISTHLNHGTRCQNGYTFKHVD